MPGSRRPSIASVHSVSSVRSYSTRKFEKERQQKEEREIRLGKLSRANSTNRVAPTPSPHSTDDLLPTLEEDKQVCNIFVFKRKSGMLLLESVLSVSYVLVKTLKKRRSLNAPKHHNVTK